MNRACAIASAVVCRTSGIFCRFCAGAFRRWCRKIAFGTGECPARCRAVSNGRFKAMINRLGIAALWFFGLTFVFAAINKNDPYLISLRGAGNVALAIASIVIYVA